MLMESRFLALIHNFQKLWWYCHIQTWSWVIHGRVMRARSESILGIDRRRFEIVGIGGIRHYLSDHLFLRARIIIFPTEAVHNCDVGAYP